MTGTVLKLPRINLGGGLGRRADWATPRWLFAMLDAEFHFTLDVCANHRNTKCRRYISEHQDSLLSTWGDRDNVCWMNPPYGQKNLPLWVRKAFIESKVGHTVVCLLPSRTDASWWHEYVMKCAEVRFIRSRLAFDDGPRKSPFASVIVIFRPGARRCVMGAPIISPARGTRKLEGR